MVSFGRYLLTPEIYPHLERLYNPQSAGEFYLTDALQALAQDGKLFACNFAGTRHDTGEPLGYLKTLTQIALQRPDLKDEYLAFLKELVKGR